MTQVQAPRFITLQEPDKESRLVVVSRIRVTVAVGAILLWAVTPVLGCVLPCLTETHAKQECSHHMAMHCGRSTITSGSSCCLISSHPDMMTVKRYVPESQKRTGALVAVVTDASLSDVLTSRVSLTFLESPPNEISPYSPSVLRI